MRKPIQQRGNRKPFKSQALDLLSCESLILHFLHEGTDPEEEIRNIKEIPLAEFRNYIQKEKEALNEEREENIF